MCHPNVLIVLLPPTNPLCKTQASLFYLSFASHPPPPCPPSSKQKAATHHGVVLRSRAQGKSEQNVARHNSEHDKWWVKGLIDAPVCAALLPFPPPCPPACPSPTLRLSPFLLWRPNDTQNHKQRPMAWTCGPSNAIARLRRPPPQPRQGGKSGAKQRQASPPRRRDSLSFFSG